MARQRCSYIYSGAPVQLVEIQEEQPDVPKIHLKPVKLAEVEALPTETFVDVIAVLDTCQDLGLIQRRDGSEGKKRSMVVRDDSGRSIELTLWGEKAENVGAELFEHSRAGQHPVLVIKSASPCSRYAAEHGLGACPARACMPSHTPPP